MVGRGRRISEFEASLVYRESSRTARTIQINPVLKKKTKEEQERSLEKARERLRSLPEHQQDAIADKYYGGVRRW